MKLVFMRIFHWETKVKNEVIADGYLLAENRSEAEKKLKLIPFHDKYEITDLDDSDCGTDGCKLDENGIGIRWED